MAEHLGGGLLTREQLTALVDAIMEVDVGDGCREGRLQFVAEWLGSEWAEYARMGKVKHHEVFVVLLEHFTTETWNVTTEGRVQEAVERMIGDYAEEDEPCPNITAYRWTVAGQNFPEGALKQELAVRMNKVIVDLEDYPRMRS